MLAGCASSSSRSTTAVAAQTSPATAPAADENPFAGFTRAWRDDPAWNGGAAEVAEYDATRDVDGKTRHCTALIVTNKEMADPVTRTRSVNGRGREAFRQQMNMGDAADGYFEATMAYVGTADLKSLLLRVIRADSSGVAFKQFVNHKGTFEWQQFSPLPGQGQKSETVATPPGLVFRETLMLVLRGYPFDAPRPIDVRLMPAVQTPGWTPVTPEPYRIEYVGRETLQVSGKDVAAYHLRVFSVSPTSEPETPMEYWFDADPTTRHVPVQYRGPFGRIYRLRSVKYRAD
ncbi:MAG: DUF3108 domain-containing protein [Planctomycetes bacterium]|nr:DUF3108 domain-containing protein [Planctomycetota bacterium]